VLICLDDLQWADPMTLMSLRLLPVQLAAHPLAWMLTRAGLTGGDEARVLFDLLTGDGATCLRLAPLADSAVAEIVTDEVGAPPGPALLRLAAEAEGNPALLADVLACLHAHHAITIDGGQAVLSGSEVPKCLPPGVTARLARLGQRARQLVETAAVLGRSFRPEDAAAMLGTSAADLLPAVDEAEAAGLLVTTADALRFRHQLVWQAIAGGLAPPIRQALHRQFGEFLLARGAPVQAAGHLMAGVRAGDRPGLARLDEALPGILPVSPRAAADLAARALSLTGPGDPARQPRTVATAEALVAASRLDDADQVIRGALSEPMPGHLEARLRCALARLLHLRGHDSSAVAEAERTLGEPGLPPQVRDHALIALLQALAGRHDNRGGGQIASAIRREPAGYTQEVRVAALIVLALIRWDEGRMSEALQLCHESILLAGGTVPDLRLAQAWLTLAARLVDVRRFAEAGRLIELAGQQADTLTDLEPGADPALLRARIGLAEGRLDDAVAEAESAREIAVALGARAHLGHAVAILARIALRRGDLGVARDLRPGPGQSGPPGTAGPEWRADLVSAKITETVSGPAAAMARLGPVFQALAEHRWMLIAEPSTAPWLVRVALAAGDRGPAEQVATAAADLAAANLGFATVQASAAHAGGLLAAEPGRLGQAARQHTDLWARASAAEDLGALQLLDGRTPGAVTSLDRALGGYQQAGAVQDAARVRRRLRQAGVRRRHWTAHRGPETGWDSLTDTERSISELVAQGLSNQAVANRKYVSVHTVAFHLRQVFRKLGISSRVELARIAVEQLGPPAEGLPAPLGT
jgi:DNA-binding CsgD family transcriptional regulator